VKNRLSGFACLVVLCCAAPLAAQQPPEAQAPPPEAQTAPPNAQAAAPDAQTPPTEAQAAAPDAQTAPPDAQAPPPDAQAPTGEAPPPAGASPFLRGKLPLPPLPKIVDIRMPGERGIAFGLGGWSPDSNVSILKGRAAPTEYPGSLYLNSARRYGESVEFSVAAGLHNVVRFTYDVTRAGGSNFAPTDLVLWNRHYYAGNYITTSYRLRHLKASFEYLTWPYPVKTSRFRLRSMWQVQYIDIQTTFNAPLNPTTDANGNPIVDAMGNLVLYDATGTKWYVTPAVGLEAQQYFTPNISLEAAASAFAIPHHTNLWDMDAALNVRIARYEVRLGIKDFHFHSSPNVEFAMRGSLIGPFIELRWHSDVSSK